MPSASAPLNAGATVPRGIARARSQVPRNCADHCAIQRASNVQRATVVRLFAGGGVAPETSSACLLMCAIGERSRRHNLRARLDAESQMQARCVSARARRRGSAAWRRRKCGSRKWAPNYVPFLGGTL